jgi:non-ribosomal peptide synthetase component E (peptide arylation enzyme)
MMGTPTRFSQGEIEEYTRKGYWEPATLAMLWERNAKEHPDREAIGDSRTRVTWSQGNQLIDRLALGFLELGIRGEMIVVQLPNCVELCLIRVACEKAGLHCLPLFRTLRHREVETVLRHTEAVGVVIPWRFRDFDYFEMVSEIRCRLPNLRHVFVNGESVPEGTISLRQMMERPLEKESSRDKLHGTRFSFLEFCLVFHTTGTTGLPKLVEQPICSRLFMAKVYVDNLMVSSGDVVAVISPGAAGVNQVAYFGVPLVAAKTVMLEHFEPGAFLELVQRERVTLVGLVPAQLARIVRYPDFEKYDLSSLRLIYCSTAPLPYDLGLEAEEKMRCPIVQLYGTMDTGGVTMNLPSDPRDIRLSTLGKPTVGNEVMIVDGHGKGVPQGQVGEIRTRGPTLVSGYYRDPEATWKAWSKDGWFSTGDLGTIDEQGNLRVVGRKKEMIIRGGQNIYPAEIENLLMAHPKVSNVAIVKMPDPVMGEKACACVVPKEGEDFSFEEMISFLRNRGIASHKFPERLEIIEALPMVGEGLKVDKKRMEEDIEKKLRAEGLLPNSK